MTRSRTPHEERRRVLRQMGWVFVYAPPILAVLTGLGGAAVLALFVPLPNTNFWGRWGIGILLILGVPTVAYLVKNRLDR